MSLQSKAGVSGKCLLSAMKAGPRYPVFQPIKFSNWMPSPDERKAQTWSITDLPYAADVFARQGAFERQAVRATYSQGCDDKSVVWTIVWGYPKGRFERNRPNMKTALASATNVATAVRAMSALQGKLSAKTILSMIHDVSKGIRTSTSSKIAYFAGIDAIEGKCLILDERVIASIIYHRFDQLRPLIRKMLPNRMSSYSCLGGANSGCCPHPRTVIWGICAVPE